MTKKLIPTLKGDEYQILWFWLQACKLFNPASKVVAVEFEANDIKGFDDVVVHYDNLVDKDGSPRSKDCFQVKFHVTGAGAITGIALSDPAFINAEKFSLLQRLQSASTKHQSPDGGCRFFLLSPWQVHPDDTLSKLYDMTDHRVDWDRFIVGGDRSEIGQLRKCWREHLKLKSDDELRIVVSGLRIQQTGSLEDLRARLNENLAMCGLRPVDLSSHIDPYQELTRGLLKQTGNVRLTRSDVENICKKENLYEGPPFFADDRKYVGIQTFSRWTSGLEDRCEAVLDLRDCFDNRKLKAGRSWEEISQLVEKFIDKETQPGGKLDVELHAALSVSFAAGFCLPSKRRVNTAVIHPPRQRWQSYPSGSASASLFTTTSVNTIVGSSDAAISLSITHDVHQQVEKFFSECGSDWTHIHFTPLSGLGATAVRDGLHAWELAQSFCTQLKQIAVEQNLKRIHLFASAPAALVFFIGQLAHALPPITVYEYEFGAATPTYFPGINLPLETIPAR